MNHDDSSKRAQITLGLDDVDNREAIVRAAASSLNISPDDVNDIYIVKRSIDARRGRVRFQMSVQVGGQDPYDGLGMPHPREVTGDNVTVIIGAGPAGLFAAYALAREGKRAIVIERGKEVQPRRRDLKGLNQRGEVNEDSNYCFGEGGAGTFSDGKLYTRAKKRGPVHDILGVLALHGAPREILVDARPHIGSNLLPKVLVAMRDRLIACGVEFLFETRVEDFIVEGSGDDRKVTGVVTRSTSQANSDEGESAATGEDGAQKEDRLQTIRADAVVVATGHSARDIYDICAQHDVAMEAKAFALGVRIEHPQALINRIQYGADANHPALPNAAYEQRAEMDDRGVFSFCMCPGGFIVPAATERDGVVVNGMSLSRRDSPFANSGLVVAIEVEDLVAHGFDGPLGGIEFQRVIERATAVAGGGKLVAPASRVTDFLRRRSSSTLPATSYQPGLIASDLTPVLDAGGILLSEKLRGAFPEFENRMRGYITNEAIIVATESRTSAPVRIPRNEDLQSTTLRGLFLAGEGPGYAGGIVSAALDGIRVGNKITQLLPWR